jgi:hypothetical protein
VETAGLTRTRSSVMQMQLISGNAELAARLDEPERRYDTQFKTVVLGRSAGTVALTDPSRVGSSNQPRTSVFECLQTSANHIGSAAWMSALRTPDRLMQQSPCSTRQADPNREMREIVNMRKPGWVIAGVVVALVGLLFTLQGAGVIKGSAMSGSAFWAIAGPVIIIAGLVVAGVGIRGRMR